MIDFLNIELKALLVLSFFVIIAALGLLFYFIYKYNKIKSLYDALDTNNKDQSNQLRYLDNQNKEHTKNISALTADKQELLHELGSLQASLKIYEKLEKNLNDTTKNIYLHMHNEYSNNFDQHISKKLAVSHDNLKNTIKPLQNLIKQYDDKRTETFGTLQNEISNLKSHTSLLAETFNQNHSAGKWGEQSLQRMLELAGLWKNCDYVSQFMIDNDNVNDQLRPDFLIKFPKNRYMIIDVKTPMLNYIDYCKQTDKIKKQTCLKKHIKCIKSHLTDLSKKSYVTNFLKSSSKIHQHPEFIVMYLPFDSLYSVVFSAQSQAGEELVSYAASKNIIIATPSTMLALLKTVAFIWRQYNFHSKSEEISIVAADLVKQIDSFYKYYQKLGGDIQKVVNTYHDSTKIYDQKISPIIENMVELGCADLQNVKKLKKVSDI